MYQTGQGFVPDQPAPEPRVAILGQNPGKDEETGQRVTGYFEGTPEYSSCDPGPFQGATGYMLRKKFIPYLDLPEKNISYHNVLKCRWKGRNDLPPENVLKPAVEHCTKAHLHIPKDLPVIAQGALSFHYNTGQIDRPAPKRDGISNWRGFLGLNNTFITTHIANFLRDPKQKVIGRVDWKKAGLWLKKQWPLRLPECYVITDKTEEQTIVEFFQEAQGKLLYCDTEFDRESKFLTLIGCGFRDDNGQIQGLQMRRDGSVPKVTQSWFIREFVQYIKHNTTGWHNFQADLPVLRAAWKIQFSDYHQLEDSMLAHALVDSELPHDLGFCASLFSNYDKLKHLSQVDFMKYNWGDVVTGLETLEACHREFDKDPDLWKVYWEQSIPVARHLLTTQLFGIQIDPERVLSAREEVQGYIEKLQPYIKLYAGDLNINSGQQLKARLFDYEGMRPARSKKKISLDEEALMRLRTSYCKAHEVDEPDFENEVWSPEYVEERLEAGEHTLMVCKSAYNFYFHKTLKYLNQLITDNRVVDRIYPNINIHAQATGRHSTTKPALAQLPPPLHDIMTPDEGTFWIGGDFSGQEVWVGAAESNDNVLLEQLRAGYDTHTLALCDGMSWDYPDNKYTPLEDEQWVNHYCGSVSTAKLYRKWFKSCRLAMNYGKLPEYLYKVPGSLALGITQSKGITIAYRYLDKHPALKRYWEKLEEQIKKHGIVKSFSGRRRILYSKGDARRREGFNAPMQQGGADILNMTIVRVLSKFTQARYVYGVHDSFWFSFPLPGEDDPNYAENIHFLIKEVQETINQPFTINGHAVTIPVDWKTRGSKCNVEINPVHS